MKVLNRKMLLSAMAGLLAVSLAACGSSCNNKNDTSSPAASPSASESPKVSQSGGSNEKVTITFQNIYPDPTDPKYNMLRKIVAQYEADHP